ncbi:MAG: hypothetical protein M3O09_03220 [Acidobacteriota bacterium]|nr:hypothetical protein [Acidobacteriota bacterium]
MSENETLSLPWCDCECVQCEIGAMIIFPIITEDELKTHAEMLEGTEAFNRFKDALKAVLRVSKSEVPEPFSKPREKRKKKQRKG